MSEKRSISPRLPGRPRTDGQRRNGLLRVRVTPAEASEIEARASAAGLSLSEFLRQSARAVRLPAVRKAAFDPVALHHLALLGSNVNQIARVLNTTGDTSRAEGLDELAADIRAFLDRARADVC
ncbi:plasmid mobilization protein [Roseomonas sp. BN140053]|uniref:plasmid mobilization protein n=1 Tax=Roseomonas sp. BN140053 TaxID=3391898 RepID=UPI0039E73539